jgi:hypothetical protein
LTLTTRSNEVAAMSFSRSSLQEPR